MSMFAFYFAVGVLREAGWPRKLGRFKGEGYDVGIVDPILAQSIDWGAALGAGRPAVALQMVAEMFRDRDWDGEDAPDVKAFAEGLTATSPREAVEPLQLSKFWRKPSISVEEFRDRRLSASLEQLLLFALLWGLSSPTLFESWYSSEQRKVEALAPLMQKAQVDIEPLPPLREHYEMSEEIVRDYERDIAPLPPIPGTLLRDAAALGRQIPDL